MFHWIRQSINYLKTIVLIVFASQKLRYFKLRLVTRFAANRLKKTHICMREWSLHESLFNIWIHNQRIEIG